MVILHIKRSVRLPVDQSLLVHAAQTALEIGSTASGADLSIVIGNDALLKRLNRQYRGLNDTTDVLAFPSGENDPDTTSKYLGDVIISFPRAKDQAATAGHPVVDELQLLVVHGILHLLGYDHLNPADKKRMQAAQDQVMLALGVDLAIKL